MRLCNPRHIEKLAFFVLTLTALSACSVLGHNTRDKPEMQTANTQRLAEIYEASIEKNNITFLTKSNGCTSAKNFALSVQQSLTNDSNSQAKASKISVNLVKPDYCKALTRIISISMPIELDKLGTVEIVNPKLPKPNITKPKR